MPIPDKTTFGPDLENDKIGISFGEVRKVMDDSIRLKYLKRRLEVFLLKQVDEFADIQKSYSPFPLTVMVCVSVETLGRIISPVKKYELEGKKDIPKLVSLPIYAMLDKRLARTINKEFKHTMKEILSGSDVEKIKTYSELFHSCLRNSYIHGFRPKNVFLNAQMESGWIIDEGALIINPYWFWTEFKKVFNASFDTIQNSKEKNNPYRLNALDYLDRLLTE